MSGFSDRTVSVKALVDELFRSVEHDQGQFTFSDDPLPGYKPDDFFSMVRSRLTAGKRAVRKTEAFLKKYGEL